MPSGDVVPEQPDRILVRRRRARDEEAAVAAARPARGRARLDDGAVDAALGQVPGAGKARDAGSDHEHVGLAVAGERRALLVGVVVPERNQIGHAQDRRRFDPNEPLDGYRRTAAYTGGASDAPPLARILRGSVATAPRERHPGGRGAERPSRERHLRIRRRGARLREPPGRRQARPARGRPRCCTRSTCCCARARGTRSCARPTRASSIATAPARAPIWPESASTRSRRRAAATSSRSSSRAPAWRARRLRRSWRRCSSRRSSTPCSASSSSATR